MRKLITLCTAILLIILLVGCGSQKKAEKEMENPGETGTESVREITDDGVRLTLEDATLSPTGGTFYMENDTDETVYFGFDFEIEAKSDGKWYNIMPETSSFVAEELDVRTGARYQLDADWVNYVGELPGGDYRMVKQYRLESGDWKNPSYVACEFTIAE